MKISLFQLSQYVINSAGDDNHERYENISDEMPGADVNQVRILDFEVFENISMIHCCRPHFP